MSEQRLVILTYHQVLDEADPLRPGSIHAALFERQLRGVQRAYTVLPLVEGVRRLRDGSLRSRTLSITFDDGYADNVRNALPVLTRLGMPATFFVADAFLDGGRMWNDTVIEGVRGASRGELDLSSLGLGRFTVADEASRRSILEGLLGALKYQPQEEREEKALAIAELTGAALPGDLMMSSVQVRQLQHAGMEIGGHTASHPILTELPASRARREIEQNRARLAELTGTPPTSFAYPNGRPGRDYAPEHVAMVRDAGFEIGVSTAWGAADRRDDVLQLPRVGLGNARGVMAALRLWQRYRERAESLLEV